MFRKTVSSVMLVLLVTGMLVLSVKIQPVKADFTATPIYISADGSITPPTAPIYTADKITYTLTGNVTAATDTNGIVIKRGNIVLDGAGYNVMGSGGYPSHGITLASISGVTMKNMAIKNFNVGIQVDTSSGNTLSGNTLFGNTVDANNWDGIDLNYSSNNVLSGNNVTANNVIGIFLWESSGNTLSGNNVASETDGIRLVSSSNNNVLSGNNFTANNNYGVVLDSSFGNTLSGNNVTANNYDGIYLLESSSGNTLSCNSITANSQNGVVLDSSSGNSLSGNSIINNYYGIYLGSSNYTSVSGNKVTNNDEGIGLDSSSNYNSISGNDITNNRYGIILYSSSNNGVSGNNITANDDVGIDLSDSSNNNSVSGNNITNNGCGIVIDSSSNKVYHNNFVSDAQQVYTYNSTNIWDNGYPSGGNYWSDYATRYPNAAEIDSSGLWNTPYLIDANNTDNYPLMFPSTGFITVKSEYSGYFVQNLPFNNTFGLYTSHNGRSPVNITGNLSDTEGSRTVTFSNVTDPSGAHLSEPVDMSSLSSNTTLQVFAVYSDGTILNESFPLEVIPTPLWLISILNGDHLITVENQTQRQWDNTYKIHVEKELDLSKIFNITIPLPTFEGGGNYTLLPSVEFGFSFYSNGTCEISSSGIGELAPIQFGAGSVTAHINVTVTGTFAPGNNSINWVSASFSLDVGASASINVPIVGYTFDLPVLGKVTIGLSATITFNADFGATIVLAPTQNDSEEFISGIGIMIQNITGYIFFGAGIAITAGCAVASITGEGDIEVLVYLQATQPYVRSFMVTGTVSIYYKVLWWSGTIWKKTGVLWPYTAPIPPILTDFNVTARYYNTSDYEEFTWTNGSLAGTAVHNIYPLTSISAASSRDTTYILYTDDNVSMPVQSGLCWTGLEFNSSQKTLRSLSVPPISDEIFFSPVVISLSNGSLLAMWDSVPFSEVNNATGPLDISTVIPQYSCFNTKTQSWGPIENLLQSGVTTSYLLSSNSTGCYALVLQGDSLFSNNQSLVEYDLQSGSGLLSISATNASNIVSFDCVSRLAVLQMLDSSYELLNLSSSQLINLPSIGGCQVKIVQLATDSTDSVGVVYSNATSDIFSIFNISSGIISFSMNVSNSTSFLTLSERALQVGSGYQLVTTDSSGMTSYFIYTEDQSEKRLLYPLENITYMGATVTEDGLLVCTTENYGNSSTPLLNLTLTSIPLKGTGDLNNDGKVSLQDLVLLANAYSSKPGDSKWNPNADIDSNGIVGLTDLVTMAQHYGQHYP